MFVVGRKQFSEITKFANTNMFKLFNLQINL